MYIYLLIFKPNDMNTQKDYFKDCTTQDSAKNLFRILCFELHPDKRQDKETAHKDFINLMQQFKAFKPTEDHARKTDDLFNHDEFYNTVMRFADLENVLITFIGSFIWLEDGPRHAGATKEQKEEIKKILINGYNVPRFAFKRKKWYYSPLGYKQKHRCNKSFEQLKYTWGHKTFEAEREQKPKQAQIQF